MWGMQFSRLQRNPHIITNLLSAARPGQANPVPAYAERPGWLMSQISKLTLWSPQIPSGGALVSPHSTLLAIGNSLNCRRYLSDDFLMRYWRPRVLQGSLHLGSEPSVVLIVWQALSCPRHVRSHRCSLHSALREFTIRSCICVSDRSSAPKIGGMSF